MSGNPRPIDVQQIREAMLQEVARAHSESPNLQTQTFLPPICKRLNLVSVSEQRVALSVFGDLFRIGYLAWGHNAGNPHPPFFHATELGRRALASFSRDPANKEGYLSHLRSLGVATTKIEPYVEEALTCFAASCPRASVVMVGIASEIAALDLRDALTARLDTLGIPLPKGLSGWMIRPILDAMHDVWGRNKKQMGSKLFEAVDAQWATFTHQVRAARNEVGHPSDLGALSDELAHGNLLLLPAILRLAADIKAWLQSAALV